MKRELKEPGPLMKEMQNWTKWMKTDDEPTKDDEEFETIMH